MWQGWHVTTEANEAYSVASMPSMPVVTGRPARYDAASAGYSCILSELEASAPDGFAPHRLRLAKARAFLCQSPAPINC